MDKHILEKAMQMCEYINKKFDGVVVGRFEYEVLYTPYYKVVVGYVSGGIQRGAYIEHSTHGGTYNRIFADKVAEYGGWDGNALIYPYLGNFVWRRNYKWKDIHGIWHETKDCTHFREDAIRTTMLAWNRVRDAIERRLAEEDAIKNFQI